MRIFPHLRSGFTDAPLASPAGRALPLATQPPPRYPCFALADLIRDSALNLVRYTAVCMPRLALPATSATHTLSHPLLSFASTLRHVLPTYSPRTYTHVHTNPPISRIASSLVSTPLARTETHPLLLRPLSLSLFSSFTLPILGSRFSRCPIPPFLSFSRFSFLHPSSGISIFSSFSFPP